MDFDQIDGSSGLEIAASCPTCSPRAMLDGQKSELRESMCPSCGGTLLGRDAGRTLVFELLQMQAAMFEQIVSRGRSSHLRCASCSGQNRTLSIRGTQVELCGRCEAMWIDGGGLHELTGGRVGSKPPPPSARGGRAAPLPDAPGPGDDVGGFSAGPSVSFQSKRIDGFPPAPSVSAALRAGARTASGVARLAPPVKRAPIGAIAVVGIVIAVLIGAAVFLRRHVLDRRASSEAEPASAAIAVSTVPAPAGGTGVAADFVYSGRDLAWWSKRLTMLKARPDETGRKLYTLTKRRAEASGLEVKELGDRVEVAPTRELMSKIAARGGDG